MASFLWTFETLTTTGFEPDTDTIGGLDLTVAGDGGPTDIDAAPIPSAPGRTGNGRLMPNGGHYNQFATDDPTAAISHVSGNPASFRFWWRPLIQPTSAGLSLLEAYLYGWAASGGPIITGIDLYLVSNVTPGLCDVKVIVQGFFVPFTTFTFTGVTLNYRAWNEIGWDYAGANAIDILVNGDVVGTISPTDLPMPTFSHGTLLFAKEFSATGTVFGVLDDVSLEIT